MTAPHCEAYLKANVRTTHKTCDKAAYLTATYYGTVYLLCGLHWRLWDTGHSVYLPVNGELMAATI